jgi:C-terminal processing protease CtpA/Prc
MVGSTANSNAVASSTFDPAAHQRALQKMHKADAALGASQNDDMPIYYEDDDKASSIASYMPSGGAYDVFAPPGAIGIVVDTTKKGCIVHSLKKTSPMQGLINPGDLIVALDDFDVRRMSAASLTKLMAKKSKQPERKFTLEPTGEIP